MARELPWRGGSRCGCGEMLVDGGDTLSALLVHIDKVCRGVWMLGKKREFYRSQYISPPSKS